MVDVVARLRTARAGFPIGTDGQRITSNHGIADDPQFERAETVLRRRSDDRGITEQLHEDPHGPALAMLLVGMEPGKFFVDVLQQEIGHLQPRGWVGRSDLFQRNLLIELGDEFAVGFTRFGGVVGAEIDCRPVYVHDIAAGWLVVAEIGDPETARRH